MLFATLATLAIAASALASPQAQPMKLSSRGLHHIRVPADSTSGLTDGPVDTAHNFTLYAGGERLVFVPIACISGACIKSPRVSFSTFLLKLTLSEIYVCVYVQSSGRSRHTLAAGHRTQSSLCTSEA